MVFTDPPYNVRIDGHVCGKGAVRHDEFVMASGELSRPEFIVFLSGAITNLIAFSADGSIHFICMDWRHIGELLTAAEPRYTEFKNLCVWNKTNAGMGSFYRSKHELVLVFKHGRLPHINNFGLGEKGRYRTNVWDYASVNTLKPDRRDELELHPTTKPVALVADSIRDCSKRSGVILDCFAGSGTTIIAAERTGRRARAMELDSRHVDTALRRWRDFSGQEAVHATTGESFSMVAERRLAEKPVAEPQDTTKERTRSNTDHGQ
jgi:DNA modification methylase